MKKNIFSSIIALHLYMYISTLKSEFFYEQNYLAKKGHIVIHRKIIWPFDILNTFDHLYCKYQGHKNTMLYTSKQKATDMSNEIANYI